MGEVDLDFSHLKKESCKGRDGLFSEFFDYRRAFARKDSWGTLLKYSRVGDGFRVDASHGYFATEKTTKKDDALYWDNPTPPGKIPGDPARGYEQGKGPPYPCYKDRRTTTELILDVIYRYLKNYRKVCGHYPFTLPGNPKSQAWIKKENCDAASKSIFEVAGANKNDEAAYRIVASYYTVCGPFSLPENPKSQAWVKKENCGPMSHSIFRGAFAEDTGEVTFFHDGWREGLTYHSDGKVFRIDASHGYFLMDQTTRKANGMYWDNPNPPFEPPPPEMCRNGLI